MEWRPYKDGFICGKVGVFPDLVEAWAVWVQEPSGDWREATPRMVARRYNNSHDPNRSPPYRFWEMSDDQMIEKAKEMASSLLTTAANHRS